MSYTYSVQGESIELCLDPDFIVVRFCGGRAKCARVRAAQSWSEGTGLAGLELRDEDVTLVPTPLLQRNPTVPEARTTEETIAQLRASPGVWRAMPVFQSGRQRFFATNRVIVGLLDATCHTDVCERYGLHVIEVRDDKIVCVPGGAVDVFDVVAAMDGDAEVRFAEPDFITVGQDVEAVERLVPSPSDDQCAAHELAAIVSTNHAGAATGDISVPPFAVRFGPSRLPGGRWKMTNATIARSINWARCAGADILINRWGGGPPSSDIIEELERARMNGRGGLGCVIVVAADDTSQGHGFPATLRDTLPALADTRIAEGAPVTADADGVANRRRHRLGAAVANLGDASLPTVSGACALVLAANPNLTEAQVRRLVGGSIRRQGRHQRAEGGRSGDRQPNLDIIQAVRSALAMSNQYTA